MNNPRNTRNARRASAPLLALLARRVPLARRARQRGFSAIQVVAGAGIIAAAGVAAALCPAAAVAHDAACDDATGKTPPRRYIDACKVGDHAWHPDDNQIAIVVNRPGEPVTRICRWLSPEGMCYEFTTTRPRDGVVVQLRTRPEFDSFLRWARARDDVDWCLVPHPDAVLADCVETADSCRECQPAGRKAGDET